MSNSTVDGRLSSPGNKKFQDANFHPATYAFTSKSPFYPNTSAYNSSSHPNKFLNAFEPAISKPTLNNQSNNKLSLPTSDLSISPSSSSPPPNDSEVDQVFYNPCNSAKTEDLFNNTINRSFSNILNDDLSRFENSLEIDETFYSNDRIHQEFQSSSTYQQRYSYNLKPDINFNPEYSTNIFINYDNPSKLAPAPRPRNLFPPKNLHSKSVGKHSHDQEYANSVPSSIVDSSNTYSKTTNRYSVEYTSIPSRVRSINEQTKNSCIYLNGNTGTESPCVGSISPGFQQEDSTNSESSKIFDSYHPYNYTGNQIDYTNSRNRNNAVHSTNTTDGIGSDDFLYRRPGATPNQYSRLATNHHMSQQVSFF